MREIRNSVGAVFTISLRLPDVLRLQRGWTIEEGRVLTEDFGHSDREHLQLQIERITSEAAIAADLLYALLLADTRKMLSFAAFIGESSTIELWQPKDLVIAAIQLAEEVLDFFHGRIPDLAKWKGLLSISTKESKKLMAQYEAMTPEQIEKEIRQALEIDNPTGGTTVGDSPASPALAASTVLPIANSVSLPPETLNATPDSQPQSAPSLVS